MTDRTTEYVRLLTVPDEPAMQHLLDALNVSGLHPELACSAGGGAPFLAGLTDPVADHVHYTVTDPDQGVVHCCECSHPGVRPNEWDPNSWRPAYPVTALVTEWPDLERVADKDYIDPWWAPVLPPDAQAFKEGECAPTQGCGCMCHRPGGMAVSHFAPCCDVPPFPPGGEAHG